LTLRQLTSRVKTGPAPRGLSISVNDCCKSLILGSEQAQGAAALKWPNHI
jgi:hypothetical protein